MKNYTVNTHDMFYTLSKFSSGELHVTMTATPSEPVTLKGSITCSDHVMELLLLVDALRRIDCTDIHLIMPYMAYSRQDRICRPGEALSIKVMTTLVNSCNFNSVTTHNNHSDVTTALLNNCRNITNSTLISSHQELFTGYDYVLAPDAGAIKETFKVAQLLGLPMIRADKSRSVETGDITGTEVYASAPQLAGKKILIVDDIVAGGRTFYEIARRLKKISSSVDISLFVTHGFFDHGLYQLKEAGISKFITTNSVYTGNFTDVSVIQL